MRKKTGHIEARGERSFRIRYYNNDGLRQAETITGTIDDAARELAIRLGEVAKGLPVSSRPNTVLFGELADDVLTDYEVNNFASVADQEARFRLHLIPVFGRRKAAQITTAQIKHYIVSRQNEGAKPGTVNRELELMRHTFNLALAGRKLMHAPKVPRLRENNVRAGFFTRDEVERLASELKPPLCQMVRFAFLTGWRLAEIRGLEWRNVDFLKREIRLDPGTTKNDDGRVFPMTAELRAILLQVRTTDAAGQTKSNLIANVDTTENVVVEMSRTITEGSRVFAIGEFRKTWKTACYKAGLPCVVEPIAIRGHVQRNADGSVKVKVVRTLRTFHDFRRSAARELSSMGIPQQVIMALMGHKTASMFTRYAIVGESDLAAAREKMEARG